MVPIAFCCHLLPGIHEFIPHYGSFLQQHHCLGSFFFGGGGALSCWYFNFTPWLFRSMKRQCLGFAPGKIVSSIAGSSVSIPIQPGTVPPQTKCHLQNCVQVWEHTATSNCFGHFKHPLLQKREGSWWGHYSPEDGKGNRSNKNQVKVEGQAQQLQHHPRKAYLLTELVWLNCTWRWWKLHWGIMEGTEWTCYWGRNGNLMLAVQDD